LHRLVDNGIQALAQIFFGVVDGNDDRNGSGIGFADRIIAVADSSANVPSV
jgi:hypothetical protein